jgi:hypothetical protein
MPSGVCTQFVFNISH